jgi:flavodoxin
MTNIAIIYFSGAGNTHLMAEAKVSITVGAKVISY